MRRIDPSFYGESSHNDGQHQREQLKMHTVTATTHVNASPDQVWGTIGDPGRISEWHPAIASSELTGDARLCTLPDGAEIHEKIDSVDAATRSCTYSIVESPLPLTGYVSTIQVTEEGAGAAVNWTARFEPNGAPAEDLSAMLTGLYQAGFASLREIHA